MIYNKTDMFAKRFCWCFVIACIIALLSTAIQASAQSSPILGRVRTSIEDTSYTYTFTSRDAGNVISFCGRWYEHTHKH